MRFTIFIHITCCMVTRFWCGSFFLSVEFVDFAHLGLCYLTRFGLVSLSIRRSVPAGLLFRYRWTIGVVVFYPSVRCLDSTFVCTNQNKKSVCEGQFGNVVCFVSCSFCLETSVHFASYISICVFVYWHIDIAHIRLHL